MQKILVAISVPLSMLLISLGISIGNDIEIKDTNLIFTNEAIYQDFKNNLIDKCKIECPFIETEILASILNYEAERGNLNFKDIKNNEITLSNLE